MRERGLPSLNQARAERRRALVYGKVAFRAMPPHFWLWVVVGMAGFAVIYWRISASKLESRKSAVMAKQRAIAVALGPKIQPFRDQVEGWVRELSADGPGDFVAPGNGLQGLREAPGVYLRLRRQAAKTPKEIRKAAQASLHDGFTSCLFVSPTGLPTEGAACHVTSECLPGQLCNEWNVCAPPPRPYNMRLAYRALRVLSTEWSDELHEADTDLAVNAYDRDLDSVAKHDVPVAVEIMNKARFFTLVIDEEPAEGLPKSDPKDPETPEQKLQALPHFARVGVWDIATKTPLLRLRAQAAADFVAMGGHAAVSQETMNAQSRQANSCALALAVRGRITPELEEKP
ncbi:MAG TPA: hypothetical protein VHB79_13720 [Polyangiaceae bacterium]|nr:hypothetical protein [Polyangiaceae bacterium]